MDNPDKLFIEIPRPADAFAWEIIAAGVEGELYDWFSWSNANQVETEDWWMTTDASTTVC